jgi:hypothetical protein
MESQIRIIPTGVNSHIWAMMHDFYALFSFFLAFVGAIIDITIQFSKDWSFLSRP